MSGRRSAWLDDGGWRPPGIGGSRTVRTGRRTVSRSRSSRVRPERSWSLRSGPPLLMDFLYELRCSTNYRSVDEYAVDVDDYVRLFHGGLMHLLDLGLLCLEGQIALYAGSGALAAEFTSWATRVRAVGPWATESGESPHGAPSPQPASEGSPVREAAHPIDAPTRRSTPALRPRPADQS